MNILQSMPWWVHMRLCHKVITYSIMINIMATTKVRLLLFWARGLWNLWETHKATLARNQKITIMQALKPKFIIVRLDIINNPLLLKIIQISPPSSNLHWYPTLSRENILYFRDSFTLLSKFTNIGWVDKVDLNRLMPSVIQHSRPPPQWIELIKNVALRNVIDGEETSEQGRQVRLKCYRRNSLNVKNQR